MDPRLRDIRIRICQVMRKVPEHQATYQEIIDLIDMADGQLILYEDLSHEVIRRLVMIENQWPLPTNVLN